MSDKALTKADLVAVLMIKLRLSRFDAKCLVDGFFEQMTEELSMGRQVHLSGFGNFSVRQKNARPARNPRTGKKALVSARKAVTFRAGQKMRNTIDTAQSRHKP